VSERLSKRLARLEAVALAEGGEELTKNTPSCYSDNNI
jgi:hypothetical protein